MKYICRLKDMYQECEDGYGFAFRENEANNDADDEV